jgi:hypothetical protein
LKAATAALTSSPFSLVALPTTAPVALALFSFPFSAPGTDLIPIVLRHKELDQHYPSCSRQTSGDVKRTVDSKRPGKTTCMAAVDRERPAHTNHILDYFFSRIASFSDNDL